eukprot:7385588-Prymnesium_polylepis.1
MPCSLPSAASVAVRPSTANFEATYVPICGRPTLPARLDTLMMWPPPCRSIACRMTDAETMRMETTLRSSRARNALASCLCSGAFAPEPPALFSRMSTPPISSTRDVTASSTDASDVTSHSCILTGVATPRAAASATTDSSSSRLLARTATTAPSSAHSSASARPMPRPPPVTTTRCPSSRSAAQGASGSSSEARATYERDISIWDCNLSV